MHSFEECERRHIVPLNKPAKYNICVFTVHKKDTETGLMTKLRVVRHGSFKQMNTTSINQWIDEEKCKMPSLPNLKDYVRLLIKANRASLRDLKNAFRQINLSSADQQYLGYSIFGLKFMDKKHVVLHQLQQFVNLCSNHNLHIKRLKLPVILRDQILVHINDFVLAAYDEKSAYQMAKIIDELCDELNVKISIDKNVTNAIRFQLYGFYFDLELKTVSIPADRFKRITKALEDSIKFKRITGGRNRMW